MDWIHESVLWHEEYVPDGVTDYQSTLHTLDISPIHPLVDEDST